MLSGIMEPKMGLSHFNQIFLKNIMIIPLIVRVTELYILPILHPFG